MFRLLIYIATCCSCSKSSSSLQNDGGNSDENKIKLTCSPGVGSANIGALMDLSTNSLSTSIREHRAKPHALRERVHQRAKHFRLNVNRSTSKPIEQTQARPHTHTHKTTSTCFHSQSACTLYHACARAGRTLHRVYKYLPYNVGVCACACVYLSTTRAHVKLLAGARARRRSVNTSKHSLTCIFAYILKSFNSPHRRTYNSISSRIPRRRRAPTTPTPTAHVRRESMRTVCAMQLQQKNARCEARRRRRRCG